MKRVTLLRVKEVHSSDRIFKVVSEMKFISKRDEAARVEEATNVPLNNQSYPTNLTAFITVTKLEFVKSKLLKVIVFISI